MATLAAPRLDLAPVDAPPSGIRLRPYQEEAVQAILTTPDRAMIEVATGGGKTVIFSEAARRVGGRVVILAHREELLEQAVEKLHDVWPGADVGIVQAARDHHDRQVVVASVQTLYRSPDRIGRILAAGPLSLVVVDEAHHAGAVSYVETLRGLGCFDHDGPRLLGVTATPILKDRHLARVFPGGLVYRRGVGELIDDGYLAPPVGMRATVAGLNLRDVKVGSGGDFQSGSLGEALEAAGVAGSAVGAYCQAARDRKAIMFVPTVALAQATAEAFRDAGVAAEAIDGTWARQDRQALYRRLRAGETRVVVNAMLLTEGFDEPSVDCVIVARPTRSSVLYRQMVGRGLRLYPGKADCLVIDMVDAAREHSLYGIGDMMEVDASVVDGRTNLREARREAVARQQEVVRRREAHEVVVEQVDLAARFAWVDFLWNDRSAFALSLGRDQAGRDQGTLFLVSRVNAEDREVWRAGIIRRDGTTMRLVDDVSLEYAQGTAEDHARRVGAERLNGKAAGWRQRPPSPALLTAAAKWGIRPEAGQLAGAVSDALTRRIARATLDRARRAA